MNINLVEECRLGSTMKSVFRASSITARFFLSLGIDVRLRRLAVHQRCTVFIVKDGVYSGPWCIHYPRLGSPYVVPDGIEIVVQREDGHAVLVETSLIDQVIKYYVSVIDERGIAQEPACHQVLAVAYKQATGVKFKNGTVFGTIKRIQRSVCRQLLDTLRREPSMVNTVVDDYLIANQIKDKGPLQPSPPVDTCICVRVSNPSPTPIPAPAFEVDPIEPIAPIEVDFSQAEDEPVLVDYDPMPDGTDYSLANFDPMSIGEGAMVSSDSDTDVNIEFDNEMPSISVPGDYVRSGDHFDIPW